MMILSMHLVPPVIFASLLLIIGIAGSLRLNRPLLVVRTIMSIFSGRRVFFINSFTSEVSAKDVLWYVALKHEAISSGSGDAKDSEFLFMVFWKALNLLSWGTTGMSSAGSKLIASLALPSSSWDMSPLTSGRSPPPPPHIGWRALGSRPPNYQHDDGEEASHPPR